jgi:hypothetical protein
MAVMAKAAAMKAMTAMKTKAAPMQAMKAMNLRILSYFADRSV